jgi:hypothetical protein
MSRRFLVIAVLLAVGGLAASSVAWADPPARVGRLSKIDGTVWMHMSDEDQWSPAVINYPVTTGSAFWTEPQVRADLRVGPIAIHLDGGTEFDVVALDDQQLLANAPQGRINVWVASARPNDFYSIATPHGALEITGPGTFRITAGSEEEPTEVAVLDGSALLVGPASTIELRRGEAAIASGPTDNPSYSVAPTRPTPFDEASRDSEGRERKLPARRYVSPEMTGYEDLDTYGSWRTESDVGPVWYPQAVPADWQPYRYGHWAWVNPWGWTWIDDQPWGFAPFHYGRWTRIRDRWGWIPGRLIPRPCYAPALVAFIGGPGWHPGLSLGPDRPVGWFPLAPREVYVPSHPASVTYVRQINITNVVNVTHITSATIHGGHASHANYRNREDAVVVRQSDFAGSRPVARAALAVHPEALAAAPVSHRAAVAPDLAGRNGDRPPRDAAPGAVAPAPQIHRPEHAPPAPHTLQAPVTPQARAQQPVSGATAGIAPAGPAAPAIHPPGQAKPPVPAAPGAQIHHDEHSHANVAQAPRPTAPAAAPPKPPELRHVPPEHNAARAADTRPPGAAEAIRQAPPRPAPVAAPVAMPHPGPAPQHASPPPGKAAPANADKEKKEDRHPGG